jgi:hypothetical protein
MTYLDMGRRRMRMPNTRLSYSKRDEGPDFIFIRLLEPHMLGEYFVESVVSVLEQFDIQRFALIGSMYNFVPHTRPPMVSGGGAPESLDRRLEALGVSTSRYEGPTSICSLISQQVEAWGGETMTLIVNLPQYTQLEDDYIGTLRLESTLSSIYGLQLPEDGVQKAQAQREEINEAVDSNPQVKEIIEHLERSFDGHGDHLAESEEEPETLSPEWKISCGRWNASSGGSKGSINLSRSLLINERRPIVQVSGNPTPGYRRYLIPVLFFRRAQDERKCTYTLSLTPGQSPEPLPSRERRLEKE